MPDAPVSWSKRGPSMLYLLLALRHMYGEASLSQNTLIQCPTTVAHPFAASSALVGLDPWLSAAAGRVRQTPEQPVVILLGLIRLAGLTGPCRSAFLLAI